VLDGRLLAALLPPSIILSGPLYAGGLLGFFGAFGGLPGMLRALFAHGTSSFFPLRRVAGHRFSSWYAPYPDPPYSREGTSLRP